MLLKFGSRVSYRMHRAKRAWRSGGLRSLATYVVSRVVADLAGMVHRTGVSLRSRDGLVPVDCEVGRMYVSTRDCGISRQLLKARSREDSLVKLLREEVEPGMVGLDVGANIGYYVVLESALVGRGGGIYAVEPVPENIRVLRKNVEERPNVEIVEAAAGRSDGEATILTTEASNLASLLGTDRAELTEDAKRARAKWRPVAVRLVTIDTLIAERQIERVDFVRMDIEGYEFDATEGMRTLLTRRDAPLKLFVEVHNLLLNDVRAVVAPWLDGLMSYGLKPYAIALGDHIDREVDERNFVEKVCSHTRTCPHIFMVRP